SGGAVITMRTAGSSASRIVTLAPGGRMSSTAAALPAMHVASTRRSALAVAKSPRRKFVLRLHRFAGDARGAFDRAIHAGGSERNVPARLDGIAALALHGEREAIAGVALVRVSAARRPGIGNAAEESRRPARTVLARATQKFTVRPAQHL